MSSCLQTFSFSQWLEEGGSKGLNQYSLQQSYNRIAWVYACVNAIARTGSSAPLKFYEGESTEIGNLITDTNHPVRQLFDSPNPPELPSLRALLYRTFIHFGINGGCYWVFTMKGGKYESVSMKTLLEPIFRQRGGEDVLTGWREQLKGGTEKIYTVDQVLPVLNYNPANPYVPMSPLGVARLSTEAEYSIAGWNNSFFRNGMKNPILIQAKGTLTKQQKIEIKEEITNYYSGIEGAHGALLLQGNVAVEPLSVSPKDVDFIQGKKLNREEICSIFGVPPSIVGIYEYASYANTREQRKIFWENTLLPMMNLILDLLQVNILDKAYPNVRAKWDTSKLIGLKPDPIENASAAKTYFEMGYTMEQIAIILNMPELDPAYYGDSEPAKPAVVPEETDSTQRSKVLRLVKSDSTIIDLHCKHLVSRIRVFVESLVDAAERKTVIKQETWLKIWEDAIFPILKDCGAASLDAAVDVVNKELNVQYSYTFLSVAQRQAINQIIKQGCSESTVLAQLLIDGFKGEDSKRLSALIALLPEAVSTLVRGLWETIRFNAYKMLGVTKVKWKNCGDEMHKGLADQQVKHTERFPIVLSSHPHQHGMQTAHVVGCTCTLYPVL